MSDTRPDLAAIKARAEAATEQRWSAFFSVHGDPSIVADLRRPMFTTVATVSTASNDYGRATARHIGNMDPATTLALVAYVERCEAETARLRAAVEEVLIEADLHYTDEDGICWRCEKPWPCRAEKAAAKVRGALSDAAP